MTLVTLRLDILILSLFLFVLISLLFFWLFLKYNLAKLNRHWERQIPAIRKDASHRSRQILRGQLWEEFVPFLPEFPFHPQDCRFLGNPVDYIIFHNFDSENAENQAIVFLEVKSGNSQLTAKEKRIRDAILQNKVYWQEYRIDTELRTKNES